MKAMCLFSLLRRGEVSGALFFQLCRAREDALLLGPVSLPGQPLLGLYLWQEFFGVLFGGFDGCGWSG